MPEMPVYDFEHVRHILSAAEEQPSHTQRNEGKPVSCPSRGVRASLHMSPANCSGTLCIYVQCNHLGWKRPPGTASPTLSPSPEQRVPRPVIPWTPPTLPGQTLPVPKHPFHEEFLLKSELSLPRTARVSSCAAAIL